MSASANPVPNPIINIKDIIPQYVCEIPANISEADVIISPRAIVRPFPITEAALLLIINVNSRRIVLPASSAPPPESVKLSSSDIFSKLIGTRTTVAAYTIKAIDKAASFLLKFME